MKKSEENQVNDTFVCEFYSSLYNGIIELKEGYEMSSSSSESSLSSITETDLSSSSIDE